MPLTKFIIGGIVDAFFPLIISTPSWLARCIYCSAFYEHGKIYREVLSAKNGEPCYILLKITFLSSISLYVGGSLPKSTGADF